MTAVTMHHFSGLSAPFVRSKGTVSGGVFTLPAFQGKYDFTILSFIFEMNDEDKDDQL